MQLRSLQIQSQKPNYTVVFQNENHVNIDGLKAKYKFTHVRSDFNTKYFGRFAYALSLPVDYVIVMDDDIIPGPDCFKTYLGECIRLNGIIGGNGRISDLNIEKKGLLQPIDTEIRPKSVLTDFVGHMWVLKKDWLYYMFGMKPCTMETGEDMHLCFSCKLLGGIRSYIGKQATVREKSDISDNKYAFDQYSSYVKTPKDLRLSIQRYFKDKHNIKFITVQEQKRCS